MLQALASREGRTSDSFKSCWCHWLFNIMLFSDAILIFDLSKCVSRWTRLWSCYLFCWFLFTKFPLNKRFPFGSLLFFAFRLLSHNVLSDTLSPPKDTNIHECSFTYILYIQGYSLFFSPYASTSTVGLGFKKNTSAERLARCLFAAFAL